MGLQDGLDLGGGDVLARAADDVLLAVHEDEHAVRHLPHDVAGVEPAAAPRLFGCLRVLQVAREEAVAGAFGPAPADEELALAVRGQLLVALVDHAGLEAAMRPAEGARVDLPGLEAIGQDAPRLGHAPHFHERKAEALLEGVVELRLDAGAQPELDRMPALLRHGLLVEEERRHHAQVVDDGRAGGGHFGPPAAGAEALRENEAVGREDGAGRRHRLAVHVEERQRVHEALAPVLDGEPPAQIAIPGPGVQIVEVGEEAALGPPRGPRGVEEAALAIEPGSARARRRTRPGQRGGQGLGIDHGQRLRALARHRLESGHAGRD